MRKSEHSSKEIHALHAVSAIDGRYATKTGVLGEYFSEYALIRSRLFIEVRYLIALAKKLRIPLSRRQKDILHGLVKNFSDADALRIKQIEMGVKNAKGVVVQKGINHDTKSVEVFLREKLTARGFSKEILSHIHFGLTSADVDNIARSLALIDSEIEIETHLHSISSALAGFADDYASTPMLARTHGQPASPTTFGKEIQVFQSRLLKQLEMLRRIRLTLKCGGATGNLNAHKVTYPKVDWRDFMRKFVYSLFTEHQWGRFIVESATTQIDAYDSHAEYFACYQRINNILNDFCQDIWSYVSADLVVQKPIEGEVGSSAMPHKVNPIDFENAEGNLLYANAQFEYYSRKLPISRRQRDLSDSTVVRNWGATFGHCLIAYSSIVKGLTKIKPNVHAMHNELEANYEVVAEAIQSILRREGIPHAYDMLKEMSRGKKIHPNIIKKFINNLSVTDAVKQEILDITPTNYIGYAEFIAKNS